MGSREGTSIDILCGIAALATIGFLSYRTYQDFKNFLPRSVVKEKVSEIRDVNQMSSEEYRDYVAFFDSLTKTNYHNTTNFYDLENRVLLR
jgi:hypothetical protein